MKEVLLTAGEFAKLARTTKRTVLWYAETGILQPYKIDKAGYRFYRLQQILDFQSVLLMRKLDFSVAEIASLLTKGQPMRHLLAQKRDIIEQQIGHLRRILVDTNRYYANLNANGTLVQPELVQTEQFDMYYITRVGSYARIKDYAVELRAAFAAFPADAVRLTAFVDDGYRPAKARMKIGVIVQPGLRLKPGADVSHETVPAYTALKYVHQGSTTLLSLLWQELGKYRRKQHLASDTSLSFADMELYKPDTSAYPDPEDSLIAELHMPVRP
jgi:DNA-binding transcriptional MerR regulator